VAVALGLALLIASVVATATEATRVRARSVDYPGSEGDMPAHLYEPEGTARLPGVLVLHTAAGPGPNLEAFASRLAAAGFVTMTPDVFALHDFSPDGRVDHPLVIGDARGALAHLRAHPRVDTQRLGVVGFSFGGRLGVLLAALEPDAVGALVVYYAVADHHALGRPLAGRAARAEPLAARVAPLRSPVLIHHGEADAQVPVSQGRLLHEGLVAAGKASTLHTYAGADHLFNFEIGPDVRYHPEAARLSWERTARFLAEHLAGR
jgi:carboxymethylenebutenolidase